MNTSRGAALAIVTAGLLLALAALLLRPERADRGGTPAMSGGALVGSVRSEPRTFNRLVAVDSTSNLVSVLTQAKLVRIDRRTDTVEAWLAAGWEEGADGLTYTIRLRDGVRFSDGAPFTAADVAFSFEAAYDPRVGSALAGSLTVHGQPLTVTTPDASTVVVRFPEPFSPGLRLLDNLPIFPRHRLEEALRQGRLREAWSVTTPPSEIIGLGPFVLSDYRPGERLIFSRNPHYWRTGDDGTRLPYLDRLTLEIVPDQNAEILRLDTGQIDFTTSQVRAEDFATLKRAADAGRVEIFDLGVGLDSDFLSFNLRPAAEAAARRGWWRRVEFRRAVSHAVDRAALANTVFLGLAEPVYGPVTPGNHRWHNPDQPRYPYDPGRAAALLDDLGLVDRNRDGTREDAHGEAVRFVLLTQRGNTARERASAVIKQDLQKVGIAVDVVPLEFGALVDRITRGDYEAIYIGFVASDTDPAVNLDFWLSSGAFHFWHPRQKSPATDWERRIDELVARQIAAPTDEERKRLFDEVQVIFGDQLPAIYFAAPRVYFVTSARVAGARPVVLQPHLLWNADALRVEGGAGSQN